MKVRFKKLSPDAKVPQKAYPTDAGFDLVAISKDWKPGQYEEYDTCLAVEIPKGYVGLVFPRSSISLTCQSLCNSVAVIDADYRGSIKLRFRGGAGKRYNPGDKIAQLVIIPIPEIELEEADELTTTDRQESRFGSSGR